MGEAVLILQGTVQIARKALEPPDLLEEAGEEHSAAPLGLAASSAPSQHWSAVRCGCIEGVLATAILAGQHADVWEAASMLLREHYRSGAAASPAEHSSDGAYLRSTCMPFTAERLCYLLFHPCQTPCSLVALP